MATAAPALSHDAQNERNEAWLAKLLEGVRASNSSAEETAQRLWMADRLMGASRLQKRGYDVMHRAAGNIPADPNYGLSEGEIAAAEMMNGLLGKVDRLHDACEAALVLLEWNRGDHIREARWRTLTNNAVLAPHSLTDYIRAMLDLVDGDEAVLSLADHVSPMLLHGRDSEARFAVLMPMRLK